MALATSAVLAVLVVWLLVRLVWLIAAGPQVESAPVPPVPRLTPAAMSNNGDFHWDLFGTSRQGAAMPVTPVPAAARSSLRLLGIMSREPDGYAIIADSQGRENVYRSGDELPDGARVERIEPQQVIIARNGRSEALSLDRERGTATASQAERQPLSTTPQIEVNPMPGIRGFQAPAGINVGSISGMGDLGNINPATLADSISVMPVSSGGFRVRPGRDARLFTQLGLQMNDVITAINGQPLESEAAARALFADVMMRGEVSITVNRQGREMTLRPDLENILGSLQNP
jgi:general secretion pathway protein C